MVMMSTPSRADTSRSAIGCLLPGAVRVTAGLQAGTGVRGLTGAAGAVRGAAQALAAIRALAGSTGAAERTEARHAQDVRRHHRRADGRLLADALPLGFGDERGHASQDVAQQAVAVHGVVVA